MSVHKIAIASPPDRLKHVAMIDYGSEQWAEINQERGDFVIEIYPRKDGTAWIFEFNEMKTAFEAAVRRLTNN